MKRKIEHQILWAYFWRRSWYYFTKHNIWSQRESFPWLNQEEHMEEDLNESICKVTHDAFSLSVMMEFEMCDDGTRSSSLDMHCVFCLSWSVFSVRKFLVGAQRFYHWGNSRRRRVTVGSKICLNSAWVFSVSSLTWVQQHCWEPTMCWPLCSNILNSLSCKNGLLTSGLSCSSLERKRYLKVLIVSNW